MLPSVSRLPVDLPSVLKLLSIPLRLCIGWGYSPRLLGLLAATMLVLLRVSIGWHFYTEGVDKRQADGWSAKPFFANANGPFAGEFRKLVWDWDGSYRLNRTWFMETSARFREQAKLHFAFDDKQQQAAQAAYAKTVELYDAVILDNAADLEEYEFGRNRIEQLNTEGVEKSTRDGVSSLGGQRDTIRREWEGKAAPALSQIDAIWENYEADQNRIATDQQRDACGYLEFVKPRTYNIDTSRIDRIIPYFDIAIGLCLLCGFLTPVAALAAAGFLGSVFLSQLPPASGPSSTYYQLVESMACLVLASTGAGRFAGLDFFLHLGVRRLWKKDAGTA